MRNFNDQERVAQVMSIVRFTLGYVVYVKKNVGGTSEEGFVFQSAQRNHGDSRKIQPTIEAAVPEWVAKEFPGFFIETPEMREAHEAELKNEVKAILEGKLKDPTFFERTLTVKAQLMRESLLKTAKHIEETVGHLRENLQRDSTYMHHSSGVLQSEGPNLDRLCGEYAQMIDVIDEYVQNKDIGITVKVSKHV